MAKLVKRVGFGFIEFDDGSAYEEDVVIHADGSVDVRKKPNQRVGGHRILAPHEVKALASEKPDYIVIGTGHQEALPIPPETQRAIEEVSAEVCVEATPKAVEAYNELAASGKRVAAIFHLTC